MNNSMFIKRHVAHLGVILTSFSIIGTIFTLLISMSRIMGALSSLIYFMFVALLVMLGLITVGVLFLNDEYRSLITNSGETIGKILEFSNNLHNYLTPFLITTFIITIISLVCLLIDSKWKKAKSKIIVNIVLIVLLIIATIITIIGRSIS